MAIPVQSALLDPLAGFENSKTEGSGVQHGESPNSFGIYGAHLSHPDPEASEEQLSLLYAELRRLAASKIGAENFGQSLQATELVHEAWLKLGIQKFENRAHFFGSAAEAMRRILIDRARRRSRIKRGAGWQRAVYEESQIVSPVPDEHLLDVNEALDQFTLEDPLRAEVVKLHYFAGLNNIDIASLLEVNEETVRRHWQVAKIRLFQILKRSPQK